MKHTLNILSDIELIAFFKKQNDPEIIDLLIERHSGIINKLAHSHTQRHPQTDIEDNRQNAKLATILAINKFDCLREVKFSTFLFKTIYHYLLTANDSESFVNCPTHVREIKSYISGAYDYKPDVRSNFERKHQLYSDIDKQNLINQNILLKTIFPEENIPEVPDNSENNVISELYIKIFIDSLSEEDRLILALCSEGIEYINIARTLSEKYQKNISNKQIKRKIESYKHKFFVQ